jgi:hypothetical protein
MLKKAILTSKEIFYGSIPLPLVTPDKINETSNFVSQLILEGV